MAEKQNRSLREICELLKGQGVTEGEILNLLIDLSEKISINNVIPEAKSSAENQEILEEQFIIKLLEEYGISKNLIGYQYIKYILQNIDITNSRMMDIYEEVAKKFGVNRIMAVERCIRTAISQSAKPMINSLFFATLYEKILLRRKCNK